VLIKIKEDVSDERATQRAKAEQLRKLSHEQLSGKKLAELKDAVRRLDIPTTGLLEKDDFIQAILSSKPSAHSRRPGGGRSEQKEREKFGDRNSEKTKQHR
jgi:hypothetical protein